MSSSDPKERLYSILSGVDEDTATQILDFTEYLLNKDDKNTFGDSSKQICIEPLPMKQKWDDNTTIKREDAYSEGRGL